MVCSMMSYAQLPSSFWRYVVETTVHIWFVGYPKEIRGGIFFDPQENRVFISINVTF